jgi:hypothetical protein
MIHHQEGTVGTTAFTAGSRSNGIRVTTFESSSTCYKRIPSRRRMKGRRNGALRSSKFLCGRRSLDGLGIVNNDKHVARVIIRRADQFSHETRKCVSHGYFLSSKCLKSQARFVCRRESYNDNELFGCVVLLSEDAMLYLCTHLLLFRRSFLQIDGFQIEDRVKKAVP